MRIAREAKVNRQNIALRADQGDQSWLNFRDAIRVILPGVEDDARDTCLCTCVRPGDWEFLLEAFFFELETTCDIF